jgi:phosphoglycerol transferase MdoB-like AlkP superfamily enzyme
MSDTRIRPLDGIIRTSALNIGFLFLAKQNFYDFDTRLLSKITSEGTTKSTKPRFFYFHFMSPHPPFVMDSTGAEASFLNQGRHRINARSYVHQVQGLNKLLMKQLVPLVKASPNSIFIIMGDHGYRFLADAKKESFTVFLAYKGPNKEELDTLKVSNEIFQLILGHRD